MKIIFDYNRTLYNPETASLYRGVVSLLKNLSQENELFLISKKEEGRAARLQELGIAQYFQKITFVENKTTATFLALTGTTSNVLVVGDRIRGEIQLGNQLGFTTVWLKRGKFATELPEKPEEKPDYTITRITALASIITRYE